MFLGLRLSFDRVPSGSCLPAALLPLIGSASPPIEAEDAGLELSPRFPYFNGKGEIAYLIEKLSSEGSAKHFEERNRGLGGASILSISEASKASVSSIPSQPSADAHSPLFGYSLITSGNTPLSTQIKKQITVKADL